MRISTAIREAWRAYRARPGDSLRFLLLQTVLRLIPLTPLLFLCRRETVPLALLAVPLFLLVVPPARYSAAVAMQDALNGGSLFQRGLVGAPGYRNRLWQGLKQGLLLVLWALPAIAATAAVVFLYSHSATAGVTDGFTLIATVMRWGGENRLLGFVYALLIYLATCLPLAVGLLFHSGRRHAAAIGKPDCVRGHRGGVMGCALVSLVVFLPFVAATGWIVRGYLGQLAGSLSSLSGGLKGFSLPAPDQNLYWWLAAFLLLCLPAIPLKGLISAAYVRGLGTNQPE